MILKYVVTPEKFGAPVEFGVKYEHPKRILTVGGRSTFNSEMLAFITDILQPKHVPTPKEFTKGTTKYVITRFGYKKFLQVIAHTRHESIGYSIEEIRSLKEVPGWG